MTVSDRDITVMNAPPPQPQQQQLPPPQVSTVTPQMPSGVESVYVSYGWGRPAVMVTLDATGRRKLMKYAVILLVLGPLIVALLSACMALGHYYVAYGYAAGVLASITRIVFTCYVDIGSNKTK